MERNQLIYAVEVAKQQNITHAAEKLYISQPSLSNQIIHLEEELGVSLFERQKKRVFLTEAGEVFVNRASQILKELEEVKDIMSDYALCRQGRLRIGILPLMLPLNIPAILEEFQIRYPDLELTLKEDGSQVLLKEVEDKELDAAMILGSVKFQSEEVTSIPLMDSCLMAVMSKNHPLACEESISPEKLNHQKLILTTSQFYLQKLILSLLDQTDSQYKIAVNCSQIESCFALAEKGFGITFASRETAEFYKNDQLCCVPIEGVPERRIYLVYKKGLEYHPALKAFVEFIKKKYKFLK